MVHACSHLNIVAEAYLDEQVDTLRYCGRRQVLGLENEHLDGMETPHGPARGPVPEVPDQEAPTLDADGLQDAILELPNDKHADQDGAPDHHRLDRLDGERGYFHGYKKHCVEVDHIQVLQRRRHEEEVEDDEHREDAMQADLAHALEGRDQRAHQEQHCEEQYAAEDGALVLRLRHLGAAQYVHRLGRRWCQPKDDMVLLHRLPRAFQREDHLVQVPPQLRILGPELLELLTLRLARARDPISRGSRADAGGACGGKRRRCQDRGPW
mmetsp:Transcript_22494/g.64708  ORF Transcript_22494/g.64708 Transcript_22494/m.64708 type:complete len:268 (-) Transcript_22494:66-869(-)